MGRLSELEEIARRYDDLKRAITSLLFVVDGAGRFLDVNEEFSRRLGYFPSELAGMRLYEIIDGKAEDPRQKMMPFFARNGGRQTLVAKDGRRVAVSPSSVGRYTEDGRFAGALVVCRALDEGKERVGAIEEAAQEMNQPLSGIYGYSELLKGTVGPRDPAYRYAKKIYEQSERLAALVKRIKAEQGLPPDGLAPDVRPPEPGEQETDR
ncbi:MAG: PAS domain S-box protein [Verrucomicrobia bacterium]|nr:PAS domain S-box protein [Verrucomicrobiota bacterium]